MTKIEQETSITYNAEEEHAIVCAHYPKDQRRIERMGFTPFRKTSDGRWYQVPKRCISIRRPKRVILSESQKTALRQRLQKAVSAKNRPVLQGKLGITISEGVQTSESDNNQTMP